MLRLTKFQNINTHFIKCKPLNSVLKINVGNIPVKFKPVEFHKLNPDKTSDNIIIDIVKNQKDKSSAKQVNDQTINQQNITINSNFTEKSQDEIYTDISKADIFVPTVCKNLTIIASGSSTKLDVENLQPDKMSILNTGYVEETPSYKKDMSEPSRLTLSNINSNDSIEITSRMEALNLTFKKNINATSLKVKTTNENSNFVIENNLSTKYLNVETGSLKSDNMISTETGKIKTTKKSIKINNFISKGATDIDSFEGLKLNVLEGYGKVSLTANQHIHGYLSSNFKNSEVKLTCQNGKIDWGIDEKFNGEMEILATDKVENEISEKIMKLPNYVVDKIDKTDTLSDSKFYISIGDVKEDKQRIKEQQDELNKNDKFINDNEQLMSSKIKIKSEKINIRSTSWFETLLYEYDNENDNLTKLKRTAAFE